uniref:Uncharacterized protein n=1 Tax=Rhizophora mucronata TaxID=61149 RepID=A0A2P2IZA1_RHIMU
MENSLARTSMSSIACQQQKLNVKHHNYKAKPIFVTRVVQCKRQHQGTRVLEMPETRSSNGAFLSEVRYQLSKC